MSLYYQDEFVTLYHGDSQEVLGTFEESAFDCVITDPPYAERTHSKMVQKSSSGFKQGVTEFTAISLEDLVNSLAECGRVSRTWVIATLDYSHAVHLDENPPSGLKCQRVGVWVKPNATPQISGDRPSQGWEAISYFHKEGIRSKWNGGGKHGNYVKNSVSGIGHPTAKPISMVEDWVRQFTFPGDTLLDPFAGSGTTLLAALNEGRKAVGVEIEERYCELMAKRLSNHTMSLFA